nr:MAG TPA: nucelotide kinase [Caudoviricetes sp.]
MIYKNDDGGGKVFWKAVTADRVILPNGEEAKRLTHEPTGWWLLDGDDEYWVYAAEEIGRVVFTPGSRMMAYPVGDPHAICDKSEYEYEIKDNAIVIKERVDRFESTALDEERTLSSDNVSHPSHYADGWSNGAEVIDLTEHLSFCAGNVVKYVCRAGRKDSDKHVEDLEKARWYLDREIARVMWQ